MDWHNKSCTQIVNTLKTDIKKGLTETEAQKRIEKYGYNRLVRKKKKSIVAKFFSQFSDFMVLILLAAAAISFFTAIFEENGDFIDPIMILLIVILNAVIGTLQECKAEKAIDALKKLSAPHSRVIRNGETKTILSEELVPGDIISVEAGDLLCADARLIDGFAIKAEESSLTGESVPAEKHPDIICKEDTAPADRVNMLYSSTFVTAGHGTAVVVETGMNTQVGKIAAMINNEESPQTPLQKSLAKTGKALGICAIIICVIIFGLGLLQKIQFFDMFMISISLAVAAIPEGLPAIVTIVLALGVRKMALHRAIVRHLPAVETLGSASVICSDKTGTLTQNKMTVANISTADGTVNAHSENGTFILSLVTLCNNSTLRKENKNYHADGDPTETALVIAAANINRIKNDLDRQFPRINEIPFDSKRKRMTTVHRLSTGGYRIITKGAPDILLPLCSMFKGLGGNTAMTDSMRKKLLAENNALAQKAMRVIAVAYKDTNIKPSMNDNTENGLIFCGFVGMTDPPRPQAYTAVSQCKKAGIRPVMITGDHITTAKAVASQLGIFTDRDKSMTGAELDKMSQSELERNIYKYSVFARVSPEHKVRIVKAFQSRGAVVAMTGDGVNDAPALSCADIGCAMGIGGTDVAKNAADMILTDDNFATIVEAVEQGRGIFENIRKTIHFLLSSNIGEILTVLSAFLMRLPSPLLAIQLLWINLVTDSLPALALGVEPTPHEIMNKKPSDTKHGIFYGNLVFNIVTEGCFIGALAFLAFTIGRIFFDTGSEPVIGRTMTFAVLSLSQLVHSFNLRSEQSIFKTGIFGNIKLVGAFLIGTVMQITVISVPALSLIFKTTPLSFIQWLIVTALSFVPLIIVEIEKKLQNKNP